MPIEKETPDVEGVKGVEEDAVVRARLQQLPQQLLEPSGLGSQLAY